MWQKYQITKHDFSVAEVIEVNIQNEHAYKVAMTRHKISSDTFRKRPNDPL